MELMYHVGIRYSVLTEEHIDTMNSICVTYGLHKYEIRWVRNFPIGWTQVALWWPKHQ